MDNQSDVDIDEVGLRIGRRLVAIHNTINTSLVRTIFIAGYGYIQVVFNSGDDSVYNAMVLLTFSLSLLSTFIGSLLLYYLQVEKKSSYMKFALTLDSFNNVARLQFQLFLLSATTYMISLSREGFNKFESSNDKYIPFVICLVSLVVIFSLIWVIIGRQLEFQDIGNNETTSRANYKKEDIKHVIQSFAKKATMRSDEDDLEFAARVKNHNDVISTRAVYIAGVVQYGLKRYSPSANYLLGGSAYIAFVTLATVLALTTVFLSSVSAIFIEDTLNHAKKAYVLRIQDIISLSTYCYFAAFLLLFVVIILIPYGNGYGSLSSVNLYFGIFAITASLLVFRVCCRRCNSTVYSISNDCEEVQKIKKTFIDNCINQSSTTGGQSTITAGFVYSTILSFYGDAYSKYGDSFKSYTYLIVAITTVTFGLMAVIFDTIFCYFANHAGNLEQVYMYILKTRWVSLTVQNFYFISLISCFVVYAMFGVVIAHDNFIPLLFSMAGLLSIGGATVYLEGMKDTLDAPKAIYSQLLDHASGSHINQNEEDSAHPAMCEFRARIAESRKNNMSTVCFKLLFLGGAAYSYGLRYTFHSEQVGSLYVSSLSFTFAVAVSLVPLSLLFNIAASRETVKVGVFYIVTEWLYQLAVLLASLLLVSFIIAVITSAFAERELLDAPYIMTIIVVTGVVTIILASASIAYIITSASRRNISEEKLVESGMTHERVDRYLAQIETLARPAGFVVSYVASELISSKALSIKRSYNLCYFLTTSITFTCSMLSVCQSVQISYFISNSKTPKQWLNFGYTVSAIKNSVFILTTISLLSWNLSLLFVKDVKSTSTAFYGTDIIYAILIPINILLIVLATMYIQKLDRKGRSADTGEVTRISINPITGISSEMTLIRKNETIDI